MKKLFALMVLVLCAHFSHAADLSVSLNSMNLRQSGTVAHDKPTVLTSVVDSIGTKGLYAGSFWSTGLDTNFNQDGGDEMGVFFGLMHQFGKFRTDVGVTYFNLAPVNKFWSIGDEIRMHGDIQYAVHKDPKVSISPFVRLEYKNVSGLPNGFFTHVGIRSQLHVSPILTIHGEGALLHNAGVYGSDRGLSAYGDIDWRWKIDNLITLSIPTVRVTSPITVNDKEPHWTIGVGLHVRF